MTIDANACATRDLLDGEAMKSGEMRADVDVEQLVFDLVSYQAIANVAALIEDHAEFRRARRTSLGRIRSTAVARNARSNVNGT